MPSQKHTRYKLLLDDGLPPKEAYSKTNNLHNARHIKHDLKKGGAKDEAVYGIAVNDGRIPIRYFSVDELVESTGRCKKFARFSGI